MEMHTHDVVGAWYYDAIGAQFPPHVIVFHADGTLVSSNPDRGEATNSASSGMGVWRRKRREAGDGGPTYACRFVEVNASPDAHTHTGNPTVDFVIEVHAGTFIGSAEAIYTNPDGTPQAGPFPARLRGQRITLDSAPPVAAS